MIASVKSQARQPVAGSPEWWRARLRGDHLRNRLPRRRGITLDRIAAATVALIERDGLEAVSMRRVAAELGTGPASLYRHVASRDELLVVVADELLGSRLASRAGHLGDWRTDCERYAHRFRDALLVDPALLELVIRGQLLGPNALRIRENLLSHLTAAGFTPALAVRTYLTITHFVIGAVQLDDRSTKRDPAQRASLQALFHELDPGLYPSVQALGDELGGMHPDEEFGFGLTALLDGIASQRERPSTI